jgi:hypothetical protein
MYYALRYALLYTRKKVVPSHAMDGAWGGDQVWLLLFHNLGIIEGESAQPLFYPGKWIPGTNLQEAGRRG